MRFVIRQYNNKPRKLKLASTISSWNTIASTGNTTLIKENIYRDPYGSADAPKSHVIDKLNTWYLYKCAYCERIYKLDVEHYRPKAEVRDENNDIVQVTNSVGVLLKHPGYYWLCYEWSNLIPACITCNREGGKNSKFPTINHYEQAPVFNPPGILDYDSFFVNTNPLLSEQPYLLHPEVDNPVGFFNFIIDPDYKGIRIEGNDAAGRGRITADICKLNREEIRYDRVQEVIVPIRKTMLSHLKVFIAQGRNLADFKSKVNGLIQKIYDDTDDPSLNHTLLREFIVRNSANFETIVIPFMTKRTRGILLEAFRNYTPV